MASDSAREIEMRIRFRTCEMSNTTGIGVKALRATFMGEEVP